MDHHVQSDGNRPPAAGVIDPVCGMTVDPHTTPHRHTHQGHPYYFCSAGCRTRFAADPAKYLDPSKREAAKPVPAGTIYTCPMHPEIRQQGPGSCPICGMALEPELPGAETGPNPELVDMTRRFWIGREFRAAAGGAEIVSATVVLMTVRRRVRIDAHAADRIGRALIRRMGDVRMRMSVHRQLHELLRFIP